MGKWRGFGRADGRDLGREHATRSPTSFDYIQRDTTVIEIVGLKLLKFANNFWCPFTINASYSDILEVG